ncbi:phytoene synthase [Fulvitalea axinellae]|uniref:Phytoene synthase n=1 Tax=Fulvitalea axinellae TaxID=1182444 RepID=A0AAU9D1Q7_9BACT|nr:phytoene synthase [Fulvitalea axinellae]
MSQTATELYDKVSAECGRLVTIRYSTSFSLGTRLLSKQFRTAIYSIYGFVRFADEIVDTFLHVDREKALAEFRADTHKAINDGFSSNPILHAYANVTKRYGIETELTEAFFRSMAMDLNETRYTDEAYREYIYGSAEVVGLMCLHVFCEGDSGKFESLRPAAKRLGAAFQKVNFLRDLKDDYDLRGRFYFPGTDFGNFNETSKAELERDIEADFREALSGILHLPKGARTGVFLAYVYYKELFAKLRKASAKEVMRKRFRIPNILKLFLLLGAYIRMSVLPPAKTEPVTTL